MGFLKFDLRFLIGEVCSLRTRLFESDDFERPAKLIDIQG